MNNTTYIYLFSSNKQLSKFKIKLLKIFFKLQMRGDL